MRRIAAIVLCCAFLLFGLIRIGVGTAMIGQELGWWAFGGEMAEALADTHRFVGERETNMLGFVPLSYFLFIVGMGLALAAGAILALWRRRLGYGLIALYLAMHGLLFLNFLTVNPKIAYLLVGTGLLVLLILLQRDRPGALAE